MSFDADSIYFMIKYQFINTIFRSLLSENKVNWIFTKLGSSQVGPFLLCQPYNQRLVQSRDDFEQHHWFGIHQASEDHWKQDTLHIQDDRLNTKSDHS